MNYDIQIKIAVANTRFGPWQNQALRLSEFYARLVSPARSTEIRAAYLALKKRDQDQLKDVGGFVGGELTGGMRKNGHVASRCLITLDLDKIEAGGTARILAAVDALGCGYAIYSTRKHAPEAPRLRVVVPLLNPLTADEYEPAARILAHYIDPSMQAFDRTTFEPARLMYWPSCCSDSEYVFASQDRPLTDGRALLSTLPDWHNMTTWYYCPDETAAERHAVSKQQDPETKEGLVGAFCRVYDVPKALAAFLPDAYVPVDNCDDRYTYLAGSTAGGAVLYENGKFLYSHHATDPAGGHLCNAFDLVRLHRFGAEDDAAAPNTPVSRLPSYLAMCKLASADSAVAQQLDTDSEDRVRAAFGDLIDANQQTAAETLCGPISTSVDKISAGTETPLGGLKFRVTRNDKGEPEQTIDNAWALLEIDPILRGRIVLDVFQGRGIALGPYPWNQSPETRIWTDKDDAGVQWYLEKIHNYKSKQNALLALTLCGQHHSIDPVRHYLDGLVWDGVPRLDTLFIDYLGAEDNLYIRAVTRKALVAAVTRTYQPGVKFDCMTILTGPTGIGKSTILRKLGRDWFSDSLQSFEGKDARELIQGVWIIEVAELGYMNKTENNQVKQFLSQQSDMYRAAYGRHAEVHQRRCVFFGTSNDYEYLKDRTGNRRFWPVDVGSGSASKSVFRDLTDAEIDQIWAEAVVRYHFGEPLFLSGDAEQMALKVQANHTEQDAGDGLIEDYLNQMVPVDWDNYSVDQVRAWNSGTMASAVASGAIKVAPRKKVCALEIWENVYLQNAARIQQRDTRRINQAIENAGGWVKSNTRFKIYGRQRGFERQ